MAEHRETSAGDIALGAKNIPLFFLCIKTHRKYIYISPTAAVLFWFFVVINIYIFCIRHFFLFVFWTHGVFFLSFFVVAYVQLNTIFCPPKA